MDELAQLQRKRARQRRLEFGLGMAQERSDLHRRHGAGVAYVGKLKSAGIAAAAKLKARR